MFMYDQKTDSQNKETSDRSERKANSVGDTNGKRNAVHLCIGYGGQLYAWPLGKRSGQRRDIQDDFTRFFYTYRRHDWLPEWYQADAK
jgi:hypothetical protein